ncbi:mitotic checkpoint protein BUB3 [Folsomia candida]|uniref:Mitotic checkpoint protein BUB3 n=1 Tax=Folsomia candida TaxID=158441 RepID=A0A226F3G0_FOLCA|nr:mitotic checkpoint protein BUB3 [Folsomia candida]OXA63954.1 Mitotic checkpoint protein BUB3 [Folsomia candida]
MGEIRSEYKLKNPPEDGISTVRFSPTNPQLLGVSSWDTNVRLYDSQTSTVKHKFSHNAKPVLDFVFKKEGGTIYTAGLDGQILGYDLQNENIEQIGSHEDSVRSVEYSHDRDILVSGGWDSFVKIWDPRKRDPVSQHSQIDEVYTMSVKDEILIVGTSARRIIVWDLRNMETPLQQRDSLLKYQTRKISIFPNKQGYVLSSIEGRVAVEYFDQNPEVQKKKYAFKCHRIKEQSVENIYPVNAISFHEEHSTFATGGSDGYVNVWDGFNKKRLCQFHRYPTGIASLAFSSCGTMLAIACSYLYEQDETPNPMPENCVYIRTVTDQETKPK